MSWLPLGFQSGRSSNPLQDAAELCSECAFSWLELWDLTASPASRLSSGEFVSWLLQLCAGQAEVSLALSTATVGFVPVMCVRVCPPSLEPAVLEPCWGLST